MSRIPQQVAVIAGHLRTILLVLLTPVRLLYRAARGTRPAWQVDLKWLFGLACLGSIVVTSGLYSVSKLTEHDCATNVFTGFMAAVIIEEVDGSEEFEELRARAAASPDENFTLEYVTLPVKGRELMNLSYDEAVHLVVGRTAEMLYADGPDSVEQFYEGTSDADPEEGSGEEDEDLDLSLLLRPFSLLTRDSNDTLNAMLTFSLVAVAILAVPLVFFSRGWGRLSSLGVVLSLGTAPFTILWFIVKTVSEEADPDGVEGALAEALSPTAGDVFSDFMRTLIAGTMLVLVALVGHIGLTVWRRFRPAQAPTDGKEMPPSPPEGQVD